MKELFAVTIGIVAVYLLLGLRRPYEQRTARWGKSGTGPKMSALSVVVMSTWILCLAAAMMASHFTWRVPPDLEVIVVFVGFCAGVLCGVFDMVIDDRRKKLPPGVLRHRSAKRDKAAKES